MIQMLVITMREGMEAFLIVAITAAYLKKTGRAALLPAVWWGTGLAILASIAASFLFAEATNKPLWEALLAAVAAVMVASLTVYMWRTARHLRAKIAARLERETAKPPTSAWLGVFAFTLVMIVREGMETVLIIGSLAFQTGLRDMFWGALIGVAIAVAIAWAWMRYGHRVNLTRFFQVTAVFLLVFVVELLVYALHELFEANVLPGIDNEWWHLVTEPYGPEGIYGQWLTYAMVLLPLAWLVLATVKDHRTTASRSAA